MISSSQALLQSVSRSLSTFLTNAQVDPEPHQDLNKAPREDQVILQVVSSTWFVTLSPYVRTIILEEIYVAGDQEEVNEPDRNLGTPVFKGDIFCH